MRKFTYLLTMLALALGFSVARADVVAPYTYDFSGLGSEKLVSSFAPPGWAHYVTGFRPTLGARLRLSSTSLRKRAVMVMTAHA